MNEGGWSPSGSLGELGDEPKLPATSHPVEDNRLTVRGWANGSTQERKKTSGDRDVRWERVGTAGGPFRYERISTSSYGARRPDLQLQQWLIQKTGPWRIHRVIQVPGVDEEARKLLLNHRLEGQGKTKWAQGVPLLDFTAVQDRI